MFFVCCFLSLFDACVCFCARACVCVCVSVLARASLTQKQQHDDADGDVLLEGPVCGNTGGAIKAVKKAAGQFASGRCSARSFTTRVGSTAPFVSGRCRT